MVVVPVGVVLVLVVMLTRLSFDPLAFVLVLTRLLLYLMASALGALVCLSYLLAVVHQEISKLGYGGCERLWWF